MELARLDKVKSNLTSELTRLSTEAEKCENCGNCGSCEKCEHEYFETPTPLKLNAAPREIARRAPWRSHERETIFEYYANCFTMVQDAAILVAMQSTLRSSTCYTTLCHAILYCIISAYTTLYCTMLYCRIL